MKRPPAPTLPLFELPQPETPDTQHDERLLDRESWREIAEAGVRQLAATGMAFQAYDLVLHCGVPEPTHGAHQWGALFAALARARVIAPVGYGPSPRPTTRSSAARIWRGVSR